MKRLNWAYLLAVSALALVVLADQYRFSLGSWPGRTVLVVATALVGASLSLFVLDARARGRRA